VIIESVRIAVRPSKSEELRRALTALAGPTEAESGCISCRILQESRDPHRFCYEAQWKAQEDLLRHVRSEHYKRLLVLMDLGVEPPLIEFHTVTDTKGLDLVESIRAVL
jgi:quinol monooxygenase YgiN